MIDLKEATKIAKGFIIEMEGEQEAFHLESVLLTLEKDSWQVIYSYKQKIENINELQKLLGLKERKIYKKVIVGSENKEIIGYSDYAFDKSEVA